MNEAPSRQELSVEDRVGQVADEFTERLHRGEQPDVEDYARRYPAIADLLRQVLPALQVMGPLTGEPYLGHDPSAAQPPVTGCLGDYRILRELGRGGMGIVYEAEQISLGRRVALKVLPFAATLDARQLQRFKNEAHAAAQLHHTHIVPVYGTGCERGVHYYAMQFIDGQTLAGLIEELRRRSGRASAGAGPLAGPSAPSPPAPGTAAAESVTAPAAALTTERSRRGPEFFRTVARLGVQAAEALDHAHGLGVIHRDIKPANLLVDARGSLWVMDFGLAHCQSHAGLTMTGDLVGTLRYMSPEQALAQRGVVDHRTDLYSLGATLYELLTLEPAFAGGDRQELLRQIAFEEPLPPRKLHKTIPAELETIVLKAMEKDPAERYATAQHLAEDLRHFLEDRPIRARRPTVLHRLRKWSRRNRAVVWSAGVSAVALLLLAVVGLTVGFVAVQGEQKRTKVALAAEAKRRQQLRRSLDAMSSQVIEGWLARQKVLLPEHKKFLEFALGMYEDFAQETGQEETTRDALAGAYYRVGFIRKRLGQVAEAEAALRRSRELYAQLAEDFPAEPAYREGLANSHNVLGVLFKTTGRVQPAEAAYRAALGLQKQLAVAFPAAPHYRSLLAGAHYNLANLLGDTGRIRQAETEYRAALAFGKQLADEITAGPEYLDALAATHMDLGTLLRNAGRTREAEAEYRAALVIHKRLAADFPAADSRGGFANTHMSLGSLLASTGRVQKAEVELRAALTLHKQLAADFPTVPEHRKWLADSASRLGTLLQDTGRAREAEVEYRAALALQKRLATDSSALPDDRCRLASTHTRLGILLKGTGRERDAEIEFRETLAVYEQLAADFPRVVLYRDFLGQSRNNLGHLLRETGQPREAVQEYRAALVLYRKLAVEFPKDPKYQDALANSHYGLAMVRAATGRTREAETEYRAALSLRRQLAREFPVNSGYQSWAGACLNDLAMLLMRQGRQLSEARALLKLAVAYQQRALRTNPRHPTYRQFLRNHLVNLARALVALGEHAEAARAAGEFARVFPELPSDARRAYGFLHDCRRLAEKDMRLAPAQRQAAAHAYTGQARQLLRDARRQVATNPRAQNELAWWLATDPDLSVRDAAAAVELAQRAVRGAPGEGGNWNTLGVARYRAGDWKAAIEALNQSLKLRQGGNGSDWFFLSMAYWRLGKKEDARNWYERAVKWMEKNQPRNEELRRFRAEAARLLGAPDPSPREGPKKPHAKAPRR
jgi:serine/threonine protein kinase/Tfp pilus assembly protein PilF